MKKETYTVVFFDDGLHKLEVKDFRAATLCAKFQRMLGNSSWIESSSGELFVFAGREMEAA